MYTFVFNLRPFIAVNDIVGGPSIVLALVNVDFANETSG